MEELKTLVYKLGFVFTEGTMGSYASYSYPSTINCKYRIVFREKEIKENDLIGDNIHFVSFIKENVFSTIGVNNNIQSKEEIIKNLKEIFKHILRKNRIDKLLND